MGSAKHGGGVVSEDLRRRYCQRSQQLEVTLAREDGSIRLITAGRSNAKDLHVVPTNQYIRATTKAQPRLKDHFSRPMLRIRQHIEVVSRLGKRD